MCRRSTTPDAARMPSAIGRSNDAPAFRTSAGARFTVMRCGGNSKPELRIALRTRSRLSRTLASGRPTIVNDGQAERDVHFDVNGAGVDAEDRRRPQAREHTAGRCKARCGGAFVVFSTTYRVNAAPVWQKLPRRRRRTWQGLIKLAGRRRYPDCTIP